MENKEFLRKVYRHFAQFVAEASARELEYFVLDSKFTSMFNYRMKKLVEEIRKEGKETIGISIMFNTEGDVVLIDADIIGKFIGDNYNITIQKYYKADSLNRVVRQVVNGTEKVQRDFVAVSYSILYNTFNELYKEITYRKDIGERYKQLYFLSDYSGEDLPIVITSLLVLEDICKYIGVKQKYLLEYVNNLDFKKRYSQES